jgi:hypothetical protein
VFAVTLVVLRVLQQVVGAFDPRPSVSALIALTAATATFAPDRLRQGRQSVQRRHGRLDAALRFWPLRRLGEVDRPRLGVFPRGSTAARRPTRPTPRASSTHGCARRCAPAASCSCSARRVPASRARRSRRRAPRSAPTRG